MEDCEWVCRVIQLSSWSWDWTKAGVCRRNITTLCQDCVCHCFHLVYSSLLLPLVVWRENKHQFTTAVSAYSLSHFQHFLLDRFIKTCELPKYVVVKMCCFMLTVAKFFRDMFYFSTPLMWNLELCILMRKFVKKNFFFKVNAKKYNLCRGLHSHANWEH